jgi:hypothetical protein
MKKLLLTLIILLASGTMHGAALAAQKRASSTAPTVSPKNYAALVKSWQTTKKQQAPAAQPSKVTKQQSAASTPLSGAVQKESAVPVRPATGIITQPVRYRIALYSTPENLLVNSWYGDIGFIRYKPMKDEKNYKLTHFCVYRANRQKGYGGLLFFNACQDMVRLGATTAFWKAAPLLSALKIRRIMNAPLHATNTLCHTRTMDRQNGLTNLRN